MSLAETAALMAAPVEVLEELEHLFTRPTWHADALCREHPELDFVPNDAPAVVETLDCCRGCIVRWECLEWALDREDLVGIWGGTTSETRRRARVAGVTLDELMIEVDKVPRPITKPVQIELAMEADLGVARRNELRRTLTAAAERYSTEPCARCRELLTLNDVERGDGLCSRCHRDGKTEERRRREAERRAREIAERGRCAQCGGNRSAKDVGTADGICWKCRPTRQPAPRAVMEYPEDTVNTVRQTVAKLIEETPKAGSIGEVECERNRPMVELVSDATGLPYHDVWDILDTL